MYYIKQRITFKGERWDNCYNFCFSTTDYDKITDRGYNFLFRLK